MFITDVQIENMSKALEIAKENLKDTAHHMLGVDTLPSVCQYVVSYMVGSKILQAKVNTVSRTWEPLTEHHASEGILTDGM